MFNSTVTQIDLQPSTTPLLTVSVCSRLSDYLKPVEWGEEESWERELGYLKVHIWQNRIKTETSEQTQIPVIFQIHAVWSGTVWKQWLIDRYEGILNLQQVSSCLLHYGKMLPN